MGRNRDEVGVLSRQLRKQAALASVESKKIAAAHAELELPKENAIPQDETLKVSQKAAAR